MKMQRKDSVTGITSNSVFFEFKRKLRAILFAFVFSLTIFIIFVKISLKREKKDSTMKQELKRISLQDALNYDSMKKEIDLGNFSIEIRPLNVVQLENASPMISKILKKAKSTEDVKKDMLDIVADLLQEKDFFVTAKDFVYNVITSGKQEFEAIFKNGEKQIVTMTMDDFNNTMPTKTIFKIVMEFVTINVSENPSFGSNPQTEEKKTEVKKEKAEKK